MSKRNVCANPLGLPHKGKWEPKLANKGDLERAKLLRLNINKGDYLCVSCHFDVHRVAKKHIADSAERDNLEGETTDALPQESETGSQASSSTAQCSQEKKAPSNISDLPIDLNNSIECLNESFVSLLQSPIKRRQMRSDTYKKRKLQQLNDAVAKKVFRVEVKNDGEEMIEQFKTKMGQAISNSEKYLILTCLPKSWTIKKIMDEFGVSLFMAKRSKELVKKRGILSAPSRKMGSRVLDESLVKRIQDFYSDDDISRACPGQRDCVKVRENGSKVYKQRRLMLCNLKEAFRDFKDKNPSSAVGFSKFAELRPKECVLAFDKHGTHSVCVCMYHQNVKLIFEPLKKLIIFDASIETYKDLLLKTICEEPSEGCYLNTCEHCTLQKITDYISKRFEEQIIDEIRFKQWKTDSGRKITKLYKLFDSTY